MLTPVYEAMEGFEFIKLFLESTLLTIVLFIIILSVILIYSLMISDIDEKTFEMAMLRALGLRSASLFNMIMLQSLIFSIPGLLAGLAVSGGINVLLRYFIFRFTLINTGYYIATTALILGILLAIFMPFITNLTTVNRALSKKIRDSLDVFHSAASDTVVKIQKLTDFGVSLFQVSLGLILVSMGLMTYYLAPAAFLFNHLEIFFFILNIVLIGMIFGLSLI
jgi:hypothetical protein